MKYLSAFLVMIAVSSLSIAKDESKTTDFVTQHLNSIGTEQARAAIKNRVAQGTVKFEIVNRGPQTWEGPATLVAEGDKLASLMKFPTTVYRTEWFVRDGKKTSIAPVVPGRWTEFGNFIKVHDEILTEGLWGGTLTTSWALAHLEERHARLEDRGLKKVNGVELHRIDYTPKKSSDLGIELYFEPDTLRHVMTVYSMIVGAHSGPSVNTPGTTERELHYRLEERFGDFKSADGVTIPTRWIVQFTYGSVSRGIIERYDITETKISQNISVDPKNFEIK